MPTDSSATFGEYITYLSLERDVNDRRVSNQHRHEVLQASRLLSMFTKGCSINTLMK
jgi:hypothetical protein